MGKEKKIIASISTKILQTRTLYGRFRKNSLVFYGDRMIAYYIINANGWYYNFELGRFTGRWCEKDCAKPLTKKLSYPLGTEEKVLPFNCVILYCIYSLLIYLLNEEKYIQ